MSTAAVFSLEGPEGMRFLTRSRLFSDEEERELDERQAVDGVPARK